MANVLKRDKQVAVISMLLEGSGVRATERVTSVDTSKPASRGRVKTGQSSAARSGSVY